MGSFNIEFNYKFDEERDKFFTNTPGAKATLEAAANVWENILQDEFTDVSANTPFKVVNPNTGDQTNLELVQLSNAIDDLVIFVGTTELAPQPGEKVLAQTYKLRLAPNTPSELIKRLATLPNNDNYEPWAASISFDPTPDRPWYFGGGIKVPTHQTDFFSVALHVLGQALGIQNFGAFSRKIQNGAFTGAQSKAVFGALKDDKGRVPLEVPLSSDLNHLKDDLLKEIADAPNARTCLLQDALMEPAIEKEQEERVPLTVLDVALLQDIGYEINLIPPVKNSGGKLPENTNLEAIQARITEIRNDGLAIEKDNGKRPILIVPGIVGVFGKDYQCWLKNRSPFPIDLQIDPLLKVYDDLIQTLKNVGYVEGKNLFIANYDWRLNPGPIDGNIDGQIAGIVGKSITDDKYEYGVDYLGYWLRKAKEQGAADVDIIAHSTGGLVTRAYMQSGAYGDGLPKVNNFFMLGVPNRGASKAWNILQDNFSSDLAFRLLLSDVIDDAYRHVIEGGTIAGPNPITKNDIAAGEEGRKQFIDAYVPTVRSLLATYDFIEVDGKRYGINNGLYDPNLPPWLKPIDVNERNSLVLDLNDGLDLNFSPFQNSDRKPNSFVSKVSGKVFNLFGYNPVNLFGFRVGTPTTVQPFVGNQFDNPFSLGNSIYSFTRRGAFGRNPRPGELWYKNIETETDKIRFFQEQEEPEIPLKGGDGTVPLISSVGQFYQETSSGIPLQEKGVELVPFNEVDHLSLPSDPKIQKYILKQLGISFNDSQISTGLKGYSIGAIFRAFDYGILDVEDLLVGSIVTLADLLNPVDKIDEVITGLRELFSPSSATTQALLASPGSKSLIDRVFALPLPLLGDQLKNLEAFQFIDKIKDRVTDELDAKIKSLILTPLQNIIGAALKDTLNLEEIPDAIAEQIVSKLQQTAINSSEATPEVIESSFKQALAEALGSSGLNILTDENNDEQFDEQDITDEFLTDLSINFLGRIEEQISSLVTDPGSLIRLGLGKALGTDGLNILPDLNGDGIADGADITVVGDDEGNLIFDLSLSHKEELTDISLASNLGLSSFGLNLNGNAKVEFGYDFDFGFGINKTDGFFFDTSNNEKDELEISLELKNLDLSAQGNLGPLQLDVIDKDTQFNSQFKVNLKDPNNDGRLTFSEFPDFDFNQDIEPKLTGLADVNLHLKTSVGGSESLPSIDSDFHLKWGLGSEEEPTQITPNQKLGERPTIEFNNVEVDLGTFASKFADPILKNVQTITRPIERVTNILTSPINLKVVNFKLLDVFKKFNLIDRNDEQLINTIANFSSILNAIPQQSTLSLNLGSFNLGDADVRDPSLDLSQVDPTIAEPAQPLPSDTPEATFIQELQQGSFGNGIQFPILTDPTTAFGLLLGKNVDLFTYDLPPLDFGFQNLTLLKFPIIAPFLYGGLKGDFGAEVNLGFGFDTAGLKQNDLFNGFFIKDFKNLPEARLSAGLTAFGELDAVFVKPGVEGKIQGDINFDLKNPDNDAEGKVRLNEITQLIGSSGNPFNLFTTSAQLTASLSAFVKVGFGWFSKTYRVTSPPLNLINFNLGSANLQKAQLAALLAEDLSQSAINTEQNNNLLTLAEPADENDDGILIGNNRSDTLNGNNGNDYLDGGNGSDTLRGGTDDDWLIGGRGGDVLDGGDGFDVASYETASTPISINLETNALTGDASGDSLNSIDQIVASRFDDAIIGNDESNILLGMNGEDTLSGGEGNDLLIGGNRSDVLDGGEGHDDAISYDLSEAGVSVNLEQERASGGDAQGDVFQSIENLEGSWQADTLFGNELDNDLSGLGGDDWLDGSGGNDYLVGSIGTNTLNGGSGNDTVSYLNYSKARGLEEGVEEAVSNVGVFASLAEGIGRAGEDTQDITFQDDVVLSDDVADTFQDIENLEGSIYNDTLIGDSSNNVLTGLESNDILQGSYGTDKLFGGAGNDTLNDPDGVNGAHGGADNDIIGISFVNNWDNDTNPNNIPRSDGKITGGYGDDEIAVTMNKGNFFINMKGDEPISNTPQDGNDVITLLGEYGNSVVDLGGGDDIFNGGTGHDNVSGKNGNDTITGQDGSDRLAGEQGFDILTGGAGNDTFVLAVDTGTDTIADFTDNQDLIGLSNGLTFNDLTFSSSNIIVTSSNEILATLSGIDTATLTSADFVTI
jgi:Ca2+-binding RTX toxin-like protein